MRQTRGRQRGVTLVELLVTIFVSALFFAAIIPVFVMASKSSSVDRARVTATNIAQSRIEAIRSLPYEQILDQDDPNPDDLTTLGELEDAALTSDAFDLRFDGPWKSDPDAKRYQVTYSVDEVLDTAAGGAQHYKIVTVNVTWDGAPLVGKPVVLKTAIYRQATAPDVVSLKVFSTEQPDPVEQPTTGALTFWSDPIIARVTIRLNEAADVDYVRFIVYADNGSQIAGGTVSNNPSGETPRTQYQWEWTESSEASDGPYTVAAVAVAQGTVQTGGLLTQPIYLDDPEEKPDAPKWAANAVVAGAGSVMLTWETVAAGDLAHYQVERHKAGDATVDATFTNLPPWSTTLIDRRNLTAGQPYEYYVYAVEKSGEAGDVSQKSPQVTPRAAPSVTDPPAPGLAAPVSLSAAQGFETPLDDATRLRQVQLGWPASGIVDAGGTVMYYFVYRNQLVPSTTYVDAGIDWSSPVAVLPADASTDYSTVDGTVAWRGTYQYSVTAVDADLRESAETVASPVQVLLPTGTFYLSVYATADQALVGKRKTWTCRVSIVSLDTGEVYPKPWGITPMEDNIKVNGSAYVQELTTFGRYQVVVSFYGASKEYKGTSSGFVDLAEAREIWVDYQAPTP
jgi:prepilin-type N-terminal cleavage/methylation domain-containing protein